MLGQFDDACVPQSTEDNDIDHRTEHFAEIFGRFPLSEADVAAEEHRSTAELEDTGLETDPCAQGLLFENHRQHFAVERRLTDSPFQVALDVCRKIENSIQFLNADIVQRDKVPHNLPFFLPKGGKSNPSFYRRGAILQAPGIRQQETWGLSKFGRSFGIAPLFAPKEHYVYNRRFQPAAISPSFTSAPTGRYSPDIVTPRWG